MKKKFIAVLVGTIIMFSYQAFSWTVSPIHDHSFKFAPAQEQILSSMDGMDKGVYNILMKSADASKTEEHEFMETRVGKPTAMIFYNPVMQDEMGKTMGLGFLIDFLAVWFFVWLLGKGNVTGMGKIIMWSLVIAFIVMLNTHLMNVNWFSYPMHYTWGELIDSVLMWLLTGIWLGWFLSRKPKAE